MSNYDNIINGGGGGEPTPLPLSQTPAPSAAHAHDFLAETEYGWRWFAALSVAVLPAVLAMLVSWTAWSDVARPRLVPARNRVAFVWLLVAVVSGSAIFVGEANGASSVLYVLVVAHLYVRVVWVLLVFRAHRWLLAVAVAVAGLAFQIAAVVFYFRASTSLGVFVLVFFLLYSFIELLALGATAHLNRSKPPVFVDIPSLDDNGGPPTSAAARRAVRSGASDATDD